MSADREGVAEPVLDITALAVATALWVGVALDTDSVVRSTSAVVFAAFVPGWTLCRLAGARATGVGVLSAVASSLAVTVLVSQLLVTRLAWRWEPAAFVLCAASICGLAIVLTRRPGG